MTNDKGKTKKGEPRLRAEGGGRKPTDPDRGPLIEKSVRMHADQWAKFERHGARLKGGGSEWMRGLVDAAPDEPPADHS